MKRIKFRSLSIRYRFSIFICILLLIVIIVFGLISYIGVKKATVKVAESRLIQLTQQLSLQFSENIHTAVFKTYNAVDKPSLKKFLSSNGRDSILENTKQLGDLLQDKNYSGVQLLNLNGVPLFDSFRNHITINIKIDKADLNSFQNTKDSGTVGKFYYIKDSIYYPILVPVKENNKVLGIIARWLTIKATPKSLEQLSHILGSGSKLYFGNADGSLWTDGMKPINFPQISIKEHIKPIQYLSLNNVDAIASVRQIPTTKWLIAIEMPQNKISEAATVFLYWLIAAAIIFLIIGTTITILASRRIIRPLKRLTDAAIKISAGDYSYKIESTREDELGKLGQAFNMMTIQIRKSQEELEKKADNYRLLFENNPLPMWIISKSTHAILDVNHTAISHYGYSREEFLNLDLKELRLFEGLNNFIEIMNYTTREKKTGVWKHKKKDGSIIMVDIIADDIIYKEMDARLILANDVTEKINTEEALMNQKIKQQEIITETTIKAQEKEREELGKELHDNINQILASTKLYLELARNGDKDLLSKALQKSYENVNLAINQIRQLCKQLVHPKLDDLLINILSELVEEIQAAAPFSIHLHASKFDEDRLDESIKLMIYRIAQEQLNNILKYADCSMVEITIETHADSLELIMEDNGKGFDLSQKSKGVGLRNIDNRVKFYKGTSSIITQPYHGCRLEVSVPLKREINLIGR
jgi:PAS domain S-box-containing protein